MYPWGEGGFISYTGDAPSESWKMPFKSKMNKLPLIYIKFDDANMIFFNISFYIV